MALPVDGPPATFTGSIPCKRRQRRNHKTAAFTLIEVLIALGIVVTGFTGVYAMVMQAGKMAASSEEDALASTGLEQRMDQIRELAWPELTDGTGLTGKVWTARPQTMLGSTVTQETVTISAFDVATAPVLQGTWATGANPAVTFSTGTPALSTAAAVKVIATITWTGRRSGRPQTRGLVTIISRGGISKSVLP